MTSNSDSDSDPDVIWEGIVKVQLSIMPPGRCLIYNEDRSCMLEVEAEPLLEFMDQGKTLKRYFQAKIDYTHSLHLLTVADKQDWDW